MKWTTDQQKVIDLRNRNILVSAAAGSGKTAVLVERIITMITEGEKPMDIDKLLIVTFTNAAAAEMRERIGSAIEKKLTELPDNLHLQKQMTLIHSAQITTIHSFCLNIIRNHFHTIDLDPSFRVADEAELKLLKSDVMEDLLEKHYEEAEEEFLIFTESYASGKSDTLLEELILSLYGFSMSYPWPEIWLNEIRGVFDITTVEEMEDSGWMKSLLEYMEAILKDTLLSISQAMKIASKPDGPYPYIDALESDKELIESLCGASSYHEYEDLFQNISWARLSSKRDVSILEDKKAEVKAMRDSIKKTIGDLAKNYFFQSEEEMIKDIVGTKVTMNVLIDLTIEFAKEYTARKKEKNLVDFNDLEHFALDILVKKSHLVDGKQLQDEDMDGHTDIVGKMDIEEQTDMDGYTDIEEQTDIDGHTEMTEQTDINGHTDMKEQTDIDGHTDMKEQIDIVEETDRKEQLFTKNLIPTSVAIDISEQYEEILIDEYQDSNLVQETLMNSISRERFGNPNIFMVGDVKQSIYKFRLARPELFMEKYKTYSTEEGLKQRIDLHKNFRSRRIVLESINFIFEQIMGKELGGIEYNQEAALYVGADYEEDIEGISTTSELLLVDVDGELNKIIEEDESNTSAGKEYPNDDRNKGVSSKNSDDNIEEKTSKELEARAIAKRIKELTDPKTGLMILDKENSKDQPVYKRATGKEIVILLRTMSGWSDVFVDTLMSEGIMAYSDTQSGYFKALEIQTVLNMLKVIDNPRQDIPLVAVLHSPIVGLTSDDLAKIRAYDKKLDMYDAVIRYSEHSIVVEQMDKGEDKRTEKESLIDESLKNKLLHFLVQLEGFRNIVPYTPIHELIEKVLENTGYYNYVATMPGGERRTANIDMLVQKAISFEATSYSGLFHFNRYIEKLHKYEIDYGEASVSGGNDTSIKIMSIHKSKGLEFPIVFVAGLGKNFNNQDARSKIVIHPDLGLGPDYIDYTLRIKSPTLIKKVMQKQLVLENLGEELRVLYVALTRAKEKLILTGAVKSLQDKLGKWKEVRNREEVPLTFQKLTSAMTFLDWIVPSLVRHESFDSTLEEYGIQGEIHNPLHDMNIPWEIRTFNVSQLSMEEIAKQLEQEIHKEELLQWDVDIIYNQEIHDEIEEILSYRYPYEKSIKIPVKMTVSELKKLGQVEAEELVMEPKLTEIIDTDDTAVPNFISKEKPMKATDRGTLYHKVLECMDLVHVKTKVDIEIELERLLAQDIIKADDIPQISIKKLAHFAQSEIATRMRDAMVKGKLKKEQQFVLGIPANEVNSEITSDELVLVQGIIDVYFEEDDKIVLVDYKTDYIPEGENEGFLVNRYKVQLDYYEKAIEQLTKKKVKERIIYSFGLEKEILL